MTPDTTPESLCIYSDGSGYKGDIGAAAMAEVEPGQLSTHSLYIGTDKEPTVFESEGVGIYYSGLTDASLSLNDVEGHGHP